MVARFRPSFAPTSSPTGEALWFAVRGDELLVTSGSEPLRLADPTSLGLDRARALYLGRFDETDCFAVPFEGEAPAGHRFRTLRPLYATFGEELWAVAGRATQLVRFERTHRFCGECGQPTAPVEGERARRCEACRLTVHPRLSPAIIVLVRRGEEALLARGARFPAAFYSTLAGFVEPGESLEEALVREVREEVGIEIDRLAYFGSEPWPFPDSLMVGFTARWKSGELAPDGREILDARWFTRDALPNVPPPMSISRRLIDAWVAESPGT